MSYLCWNVTSPKPADVSKPFCKFCGGEDGTLKSHDDVLAGMSMFLQRTQGLSGEVAREAAIVGRVGARGRHPLELVTAIGTRRVVQVPAGNQMPRIC